MSATDGMLAAAGIDGNGPVAAAVAHRSNIFEMTAAAEAAVLRPQDAGSWPHSLRAALAARIAMLNGNAGVARQDESAAGEFAGLANPAEDGMALGLGPVIAFMDKVAAHTHDVTAEDIAALQDAGISDADIVRLCELNAFLAYQLRVIAGLRLMAGDAS